MNKLIIDATKEKIFLIIITKDNKYNIEYENTKNNYEKLMLLINEFLNLNKLNLNLNHLNLNLNFKANI